MPIPGTGHTNIPRPLKSQDPTSLRSPSSSSRATATEGMAAMGVGGAVKMICGAKEERVVGTGKAPGACPSCGGPVVATDVESERRILCLPLCVKNKRKYSCTRCFRRLVTIYS
ncbi:hypothetical protein D1007_07134 [Hordeum vulgare]|nr:hypothetical protein D1007_62469 [Hordeum vulgare]KAE8815653.1 hypothetical protein D1007_07134 [Hordeum vulgare]